MCIWKWCSIWKDWDKDKCFEKIGIRINVFFLKKKKFKTTLPLTHVFETTLLIKSKNYRKLWIPVSSTDKVSDSCIRDLGFNPCLHQKLIGFFISDNKELLSEADVIGRNSNSLSKKKKKVYKLMCYQS